MVDESLVPPVKKLLAGLASLCTNLAIIGTAFWYFAGPVIQPITELPARVEGIERTVVAILDQSDPPFISFFGKGEILQVTDDFIEIHYWLKREASCDSVVKIRFYNVDEGLQLQGESIPSVKAAVTTSYIPFKIRVSLPGYLEKGKRYVYNPVMHTTDCGVYDKTEVTAPTVSFIR